MSGNATLHTMLSASVWRENLQYKSILNHLFFCWAFKITNMELTVPGIIVRLCRIFFGWWREWTREAGEFVYPIILYFRIFVVWWQRVTKGQILEWNHLHLIPEGPSCEIKSLTLIVFKGIWQLILFSRKIKILLEPYAKQWIGANFVFTMDLN
jgi:hypothetical protein